MSKRKTRIAAALFLMAAAIVSFAVYSVGNTVSVAIANTIPSLDPAATNSGTAHMVIDNVAERLVRFIPGTNTLEGELATSWEASEDLLEWTFYLREGVTFSDGVPFDADAVEATYERYKGVAMAPFGQTLMNVEKFDVLDPFTVQFTLKEPDFSFLYKMAGAAGMSLESPVAIENAKTGDDPWGKDWFYDNIVGTGPYLLGEWNKTENLVLVKNENYWRGWNGTEPDRVIVRIVPEYASRKALLSRGEADIILQVPSEDVENIKAMPGARIYIAKTTHIIINFFNFTKDIWSDRRLREAMAWSYPYEDAVASMVGAEQLQGPMASDIPGHNKDLPIYSTDLDKAAALLQEAGYGPGELAVSFYYWKSAHHDLINQLWQINLNQIGVDLQLQALEWSEFSPFEGSRDKASDMWDSESWPDYPVGEEYLSTLFEDSEYAQSIAPSGWKSDFFNKLCVLTRTAGNEQVRNYLYMAQQQLLMDELVCIPVARISDTVGVSESLSGLATSPAMGSMGMIFYGMTKTE